MTSTVFRGLVFVLGVATAMSAIACEGELDETEAVDEAEAAITVDEPVLVNGACVTDLAPDVAARVERVEDIVEMTAAQRAALGVKTISPSALTAEERRAAAALASNPCEVEGSASCTTTTNSHGVTTVLCTDGITNCVGTASGSPYCYPACRATGSC